MRRRGSRSAGAWSTASPKRPDSQVAAAELTRWPHGKPPNRSQLDVILRREGLPPNWWSNAPGDIYGAHSHSYHKVLFCADGGITFRIEPAGPDYVMRPGDRLEIPAGTSHSAIVGREGVTCVEAQDAGG
jgi:quercetin dioxygenase-like cupin family protein